MARKLTFLCYEALATGRKAHHDHTDLSILDLNTDSISSWRHGDDSGTR
jgi:hypothetical protein